MGRRGSEGIQASEHRGRQEHPEGHEVPDDHEGRGYHGRRGQGRFGWVARESERGDGHRPGHNLHHNCSLQRL